MREKETDGPYFFGFEDNEQEYMSDILIMMQVGAGANPNNRTGFQNQQSNTFLFNLHLSHVQVLVRFECTGPPHKTPLQLAANGGHLKVSLHSLN